MNFEITSIFKKSRATQLKTETERVNPNNPSFISKLKRPSFAAKVTDKISSQSFIKQTRTHQETSTNLKQEKIYKNEINLTIGSCLIDQLKADQKSQLNKSGRPDMIYKNEINSTVGSNLIEKLKQSSKLCLPKINYKIQSNSTVGSNFIKKPKPSSKFTLANLNETKLSAIIQRFKSKNKTNFNSSLTENGSFLLKPQKNKIRQNLGRKKYPIKLKNDHSFLNKKMPRNQNEKKSEKQTAQNLRFEALRIHLKRKLIAHSFMAQTSRNQILSNRSADDNKICSFKMSNLSNRIMQNQSSQKITDVSNSKNETKVNEKSSFPSKYQSHQETKTDETQQPIKRRFQSDLDQRLDRGIIYSNIATTLYENDRESLMYNKCLKNDNEESQSHASASERSQSGFNSLIFRQVHQKIGAYFPKDHTNLYDQASRPKPNHKEALVNNIMSQLQYKNKPISHRFRMSLLTNEESKRIDEVKKSYASVNEHINTSQNIGTSSMLKKDNGSVNAIIEAKKLKLVEKQKSENNKKTEVGRISKSSEHEIDYKIKNKQIGNILKNPDYEFQVRSNKLKSCNDVLKKPNDAISDRNGNDKSIDSGLEHANKELQLRKHKKEQTDHVFKNSHPKINNKNNQITSMLKNSEHEILEIIKKNKKSVSKSRNFIDDSFFNKKRQMIKVGNLHFSLPLSQKMLVEKIRESKLNVLSTSIDFYEIIKLLGKGSYGKVFLAKSVLCDKQVAIKCFEKSTLDYLSGSQKVLQEIQIMRLMNHENIIKLYEVLEDAKCLYLVMEHAQNGDLFSHVKKRKQFSEDEFLPLFKQIVQSINYLHNKHILHRDIKLDNILFSENNLAKICDFGISIKVKHNKSLFEHIGTPAYLAPEIVSGRGYSGFKSDIWSLGVTAFIALTGKGPFRGNGIDELQKNIMIEKFEFPENHKISKTTQNLISKMLDKNVATRISLKEIATILDFDLQLNDNWIDQKTLSSKKLETIASYGFSVNQVMFDVQRDVINHATALYKML